MNETSQGVQRILFYACTDGFEDGVLIIVLSNEYFFRVFQEALRT